MVVTTISGDLATGALTLPKALTVGSTLASYSAIAGTAPLSVKQNTVGTAELVLAADGTTSSAIVQGRTFGNTASVLTLNPFGGNVGVGTLVPSTKFTAVTSSGGGAVAQISGDAVGAGGQVQLGNGTAVSGYSIATGSCASGLSVGDCLAIIRGASTEIARFTASGLGIGVAPTSGTTLDVNGLTKMKNFTVATLPTGVQFTRAFVSDALGPVFGSAVVGGGAVTVPVYFTGAAWFVG